MSGAKNCPETPRQKMIGMMYLVLTAMLALNVSAEILGGFTRIRHSMESSMRSTSHRTTDVMSAFRAQAAENKKFEEWLVVANAVEAKSDEFFNFIEQFKIDIAKMEDGVDFQPGQLDTLTLKNGGDTNKPHQYALNERGESGKTHAEELKERINDYCLFMTSADSKCIVDKMGRDPQFKSTWDQKITMFKELFNTNDVLGKEGMITWEASVFHEMPADAVLAMLTKYQNDIRMAENDIIQFLFQQGGSSDFVVNQVNAVVLPDADFVTMGKQFRAKITTAMIDSTKRPRVFVNGEEVPDGVYMTGGHMGENRFTGYILVEGDTTKYPFEHEFMVGAPAAVIAHSELNILYAGYANPMAISVPGYGAEALTVTCAGANVHNMGGGKWSIMPNGGNQATISVSARNSDGSVTSMGSQTFQVRALPKPLVSISVNGKAVPASGDFSVPSAALAGCKLIAVADPDQPIKVDYNVTGYQVKFKRKSYPSLAAVASVAKSGDIIKVSKITATGPGGKSYFLGTIAIEIL